jgi:Fe-S-cluster-containing dehydrogenase component
MSERDSEFRDSHLAGRASDGGPIHHQSVNGHGGPPSLARPANNDLANEFRPGAAEWDDPVSRRNFLRVMGASLALAGVAEVGGCSRQTKEDGVVPYVQQPEQMDPGRPMFFASTMPFDGYGRGVLVLSREGRPIKIEGNPDHPASLGGADVFMQASILDLYDPDRARTVTQAGVSKPISEFTEQLAARLRESGGGKGVRLLTRRIASPTLAAQISEFLKKFPQAKWHVHDPMAPADTTEAFGEPADVVYDLSAAKVIVSLDSDFLFSEPGSLRYARQFSDARRVRKSRPEMNRLYVAESTLTLTGSMADHRLPADGATIAWAAAALSDEVEAGAEQVLPDAMRRWVAAAANDLKAAGAGKSVIIPGRFQPPHVHMLAHRINHALGNFGSTVFFIDPVAAKGGASLAELVREMRSGEVETLLILDGNPAYDAPADIDFAAAVTDLTARVTDGNYAALTAHLSTHFNETSFCCQWQIPMAHWLESWGDARAFDGTASLIQPLIAPLYDGISPWEFMDVVLGPSRGGQAIVREFWARYVHSEFEAWWVAALQKGTIEATTYRPRPAPDFGPATMEAPPDKSPADTVEIIFRPDPTVWAGEFANNAWLQELPKPFTKLTWDNTVGIGIAMADRLSVQDGDVVRITLDTRSIEGPVVLLPGQPDGVVTLSLGYGRERGGTVLLDEDGRPRGYNAYALRSGRSPWSQTDATITPSGRSVALATAQNHHAMIIEPGVPGEPSFLKAKVVATLGMSDQELAMQDRKLIRTVTLEQYQANPRFMDKLAPEDKAPLLSLFRELPKSAALQWGMVIDTTACIGCNACMVACQAENNIPVVGKSEVIKGREMHWIRIDDYFAGPPDNPSVYHQPVPCMHCEDAPCEIVCPVGATTHSPEGINEMTYNRCVGTRFCSNNCPYKVRRFNFLLYSDFEKDSRSLQYNPDVSVRSRGVMEKCTYCVQRVDRTRIEMQRQIVQLQELARSATSDAERQRLDALAAQAGRDVVNRLQTACQQSCPSRAISFGDIADPASEVATLKTEPANYGLLRSLTTKPRTSYLARITNPNATLAKEPSA